MYKWPQRKRQRLSCFDYSEDWYYFVTICTKNKQEFFWEIIDGEMVLNEFGEIAKQEILNTPLIRDDILIDEFIVMPNHIHIIICICSDKRFNDKIKENFDANTNVGNACVRSLRANDFTKNKLSNAVQWIKSTVTNKIRKNYNNYEFAWQKSFYDTILRNEKQYLKIKEYIINNPMKREFDEYF